MKNERVDIEVAQDKIILLKPLSMKEKAMKCCFFFVLFSGF